MSKVLSIIKQILASDLLLPVALVITYVIFLVIAKGVMPTSQELVSDFQRFYNSYGYQIIFIASFLEGLVLVNLFVPGGGAIVLGAIFARSGQTSLPEVIIAGGLGALCAYTLDFLLGNYGFSDVIKKMGYENLLVEARGKIKKYGKAGLILSFIHPNLASFISLVAGTTKISLKYFLVIAFFATFFWGTLWAVLVYAMGDFILVLLERYSFLLLALVVLGFVLLRISKGRKSVQ